MKISYEKLTKDHLPFFYEIRFSVQENLVHPHQIQYLLRHQAIEDIEQGGGWICKVDDDYAGFCFGLFIDEPIIGGLFVKPEFQSKGIGSTLLNYVTKWMFENGAGEIKLTTDLGSKAEGFYKFHGWSLIGYDDYGIQIKFIKEKEVFRPTDSWQRGRSEVLEHRYVRPAMGYDDQVASRQVDERDDDNTPSVDSYWGPRP